MVYFLCITGCITAYFPHPQGSNKIADFPYQLLKIYYRFSIKYLPVLTDTPLLFPAMLVLTAGSNIVLIMGLLLNLLTYDYMRFLFFTMGALILLTVIYMQITKEESADEIMKEYFENQELKEEPKVQETAGREHIKYS